MKNDICEVPGCNRFKDKKQNRKICQMHRVRYGRYKSYDLPTSPNLPDGVLKICKKHGQLSAVQVYKRYKNKNWLSCRICTKERNDRFNLNNPVRKEYKKNFYLKRDGTKITKENYFELLEKQNGLCSICFKTESIINSTKVSRIKRLAIDHCHETGIIRGLLCHKCNVSLGAMDESIEILQSAINYLKKHKP